MYSTFFWTALLFVVTTTWHTITSECLTKKNFLARLSAFNVPNYFKYSEKDFGVLLMKILYCNAEYYRLDFYCGERMDNYCSRMTIGIRISSNTSIKFYGSPEECGDYCQWTAITVFEIKTKGWILIYDARTNFFIFAQNDVGLFLSEEEFTRLLNERLGMVPEYEVLDENMSFLTKVCHTKSKDCGDHVKEFEMDIVQQNGKSYWIFILVGIFGAFTLCLLAIIMFVYNLYTKK
jgi:hypothetical protein